MPFFSLAAFMIFLFITVFTSVIMMWPVWCIFYIYQHLALEGGPKQTRLGYSPLTKSKGRRTSGGKTRKTFISLRPTLGTQWTSISKMSSKC